MESHGGSAPIRPRGRDRGQTFVEILVAIVLLGTAVGGTLTALRTTIISTKTDVSLTKASTWLRGAEEALHRTPYLDCTLPVDIPAAYRAVIQSVPPPQGWEGATIDIASVQFWGRDANHYEGWMPVCTADSTHTPYVAQLIDVYVLSVDGAFGQHIQVIKGG